MAFICLLVMRENMSVGQEHPFLLHKRFGRASVGKHSVMIEICTVGSPGLGQKLCESACGNMPRSQKPVGREHSFLLHKRFGRASVGKHGVMIEICTVGSPGLSQSCCEFACGNMPRSQKPKSP